MDRPSFEESLRALAAQRRGGEDHPTPEELIGYESGDLPTEQRDRIQEHLALCGDCARLLLDLVELEQFEPSNEAIGPVDVEAETSWQRLRTRLREEGEPVEGLPEREVPSTPVVPLQRRRTPLLKRPGLAWAVAAGLALCVGWLGAEKATLQQHLKTGLAPLVDFPNTVRAEAEVQTLVGSGFLVFEPEPGFPEYEVEVLSGAEGEGELVADPSRGPLQKAGVLLFQVPPTSLPEGVYTARIYGIQSGARKFLEAHSFQIVPAK